MPIYLVLSLLSRLRLLVIVTILVVTGRAPDLCAGTYPSGRFNVLLIVADDMNTQLGCYGADAKTPTIDGLSKRGMQFNRAYCQVPVCNPSRVSLLSGLRPDRTQIYTLNAPTRRYLGDWQMLPEYFRKNGYFTAQVGKIYHTGDGFEDPRSWDVEIREFGKSPPREEVIKSAVPGGAGRHTNEWAWLKTPDKNMPDGIVARRAAGIMQQAKQEGRPFFMGIGFRRPHAPYAVPKKYFDMYPPELVHMPNPGPPGVFDKLLPAAINFPPRERAVTVQEKRQLVAAYYASLSFVDAQLKIVLDAVGELGMWENTVIVFLGDHGYHLGEHGGLWHKMSLFEESARVPLIIYAPGRKTTGQQCTGVVELIDVYPTLVSLCGLPHREGLDGIDLSPLLNDPLLPTKDAAYTMTTRDDSPAQDHEGAVSYLGRSLRNERWRYTEWDHGKRGVELYDHANDPHEWNNLANEPSQADTVQTLHQLLISEGK
jgi:iduronate 2-sulfatase